jgi:hypothetical protein
MHNSSNQGTAKPSWTFKAKLPHCEIWEETLTHIIAEVYCLNSFERPHSALYRNKPHLVNTIGVMTNPRTQQTYLLI